MKQESISASIQNMRGTGGENSFLMMDLFTRENGKGIRWQATAGLLEKIVTTKVRFGKGKPMEKVTFRTNILSTQENGDMIDAMGLGKKK